MRLKGMAAVLNDAAWNRLCESSGSEHYTPDNSDDLSDLVNSFIEGDFTSGDLEDDSKIGDDSSNYWLSDNENVLRELLHANSAREEDEARGEIRRISCEIMGENSCQGNSFKRKLMSRLLNQGFDAGLCKARWGKFGKHPPGEHEYIDVNMDGSQRLIVEVNLAAEFEIARPTAAYTALLKSLPPVFIGKPEEVKKIVRVMCSAVRLSMKQMKLQVPPWRRNGYMQAKWAAPYKRTTNPVPNKPLLMSDQSWAAKRSVGFSAVKAYDCRADDCFIARVGLKAGYLTAALDQTQRN